MRIRKVTIPTSDIAASASFFQDVLDLEVDRSTVSLGWSQIEFISGNDLENGGLHLAFNVAYRQFDQATDWLRQRTALQQDSYGNDSFALGGYWQSKSIYFEGPDGSILELIGRRRLGGSSSTAPFNGSDLICVSEIGLPTDNLDSLVAESARVLGIAALAPPSNEFAAIGDDNGLFIGVVGNRPWFPENRQNPKAQGVTVIVDGVISGGMIESRPYGWRVAAL